MQINNIPTNNSASTGNLFDHVRDEPVMTQIMNGKKWKTERGKEQPIKQCLIKKFGWQIGSIVYYNIKYLKNSSSPSSGVPRQFRSI